MLYENELALLCDTLKKLRVQFVKTDSDAPLSSIVEDEQATIFDFHPENMTVRDFLGDVSPRTMYKSVSAYRFSYLYLLLPEAGKQTILLIGPYLSAPLSSRDIMEMGEAFGLPPKRQQMLSKYYSVIPVLPPDSHIFLLLSTFCERMWGWNAFSVVDVSWDRQFPPSPINESSGQEELGDILIDMNVMEKRYQFENELIQAVSLGQIHKEGQLLSAFNTELFERRTTDPVRNAKNYCIIMNTLLRKAAEQGGVHPIYLDRVSSGFAHKIEQMSQLSENAPLMHEMFRSYCRLVRKHTMKQYSPTVQKIILLIDSDLSSSLSLKTLSEMLNISPGYLSTLFRRETGTTVSDYIRDKRIRHAIHLLSTTHLQVQTVALHCGIMDVQYFSKIFKKQTGMTPKEYREASKTGYKSP